MARTFAAMSEWLPRLRHMIHDLGRSIRGIATIVAYLSSGQDLDVAIGLLAAESSIVTKGQRHLYMVRIVNARCASRLILLSFDVWRVDVPERSQGCAAHFSKSFSVQPCTSTTVAFQYDWAGEARFHCDGASSLPDHGREGVVPTPQSYAVTAILSEAGRRLDELTVYQVLAP